MAYGPGLTPLGVYVKKSPEIHGYLYKALLQESYPKSMLRI